MAKKTSHRRKSTEERFDVYEAVNEKIVAGLRDGVVAWRKPWNPARRPSYFGANMHRNLVSKKPYRGVNIWLLEMEALIQGYESPYWMTFKQMLAKGGSLIKINGEDEPGTGQHSTLVVLWKPMKIWEDDPDKPGTKKAKNILMLKHFKVFNLDQIEGIDYPADPKPEQPEEKAFDPIEAAEALKAEYLDKDGAPRFRHAAQDRAFYAPHADSITLPKPTQFKDQESYYSTAYHEMVHSTGHKKRLDRLESTNFGDDPYSKEELVAEMGAAMLCGMVGIECLDQSAGYIKHWLEKIEGGDKRFVVQAAAKAQKACDLIMGVPAYEAPVEPVNGEAVAS